MSSGSRLATWKERENNMRRERRRRAIAAKIYAGLRMYGSYKLPKHCDNNEVLKALCREAGWIVDEDGTTYRKGCKPVKSMEVVGGSASPSPCSSYQISPPASYNPSPIHSSIPSPKTSSHITNANNIDPSSLIPWLKNFSSTSMIPSYQVNFGSVSAPVTPPLSSPTARSPRMKTEWDEQTSVNHTFSPSSTPPSPGRHPIPQPMWLSEIQMPTISPSSPTFSLVSSSPFGFYKDESGAGGSSRMWTPGQSGACSPVMQGGSGLVDVQMSDGASDEFAFGSSGNENYPMMMSVVKPWEGERIHEECGSDELELTLGSSRTRSVA